MTVSGLLRNRRAGWRSAFLALAALLTLPAGDARADNTRLEAAYDIRWLNLVSFGEATATIDLRRGGAYDANVRANIFGTKAAFTASGNIRGERVLPESFAATIANKKRRMTIAMALAGGLVRQTRLEPEPKERPDRIPLKAGHTRGVLDPLSAALMPVPRGAGELGPSSCNRTLPVFEGMERFNLKLSYARMAAAGSAGTSAYDGPSVVCRVTYEPIAGHRTSADHIAYLKSDPVIEVWLAPVDSANMLVPIRTSIPTPYGTLIVEARRFTVKGRDTADASMAR